MRVARLLCVHGTVIAAGVPGMVLLSVGSVVAISGPLAAVIWPLSAVLGGVMSLLFADIVSRNAAQDGGIAVAAARVFEPKLRGLSAVTQWAYWLGWAPTPAIYGATIGGYIHNALTPGASPIVGVIIAVAVTALVFSLNLLPVIVTARAQCVAAALTGITLCFLAFQAFRIGHVSAAALLSWTPAGGWSFGSAMVAVLGGFFLAGWSAYGAEIALTYLSDYRDGCRAACRSVVIVALLTVGAYTFFPVLMIVTINATAVAGDPNAALVTWFGPNESMLGGLVILAALSLSMLLAINMTTLASSRLLAQMSRDGYCRLDLTAENGARRPRRALLFDLVANVILLVVISRTSGNDLSAIPTALLATANVGYFVSLTVGLVACAFSDYAANKGSLHVSLAIGLAALNVILLAFAGIAWGWSNIILGLLMLIAASSLLSPWCRGADATARKPTHPG